MIHRRATALVAATLTALLATGAVVAGAHAAPADQGGIGIRLIEAPVERSDDPRAQVAIVDHVAPGTTIERAFEVSNTTADPQTVAVYVGPASIRKGQFAVGDAGQSNELTSWSATSESEVQLAPDEARELQVTVDVPSDATEGERYGVIWAAVSSGDQQQVQTVNRVGVRMYLSVGPGGEPASDFEIQQLQPGRSANGMPYVEATVVNVGGRALDPRGSLVLKDGPGGLRAGPIEISPFTLAPGDTQKIRVPFDKSLPAGPWTAQMKLSSGDLKRDATAEITFPDLGKGTAVDTDDDSAWWEGWPFWVGLGLLLLLLMLALLWWLRRRRRDREPEEAHEPAVPVGS